MTPTLINGDWFVYRGAKRVAGPLPSNAEAWRWIDRCAGEPISRAEETAEYTFRKMADGDAT